MRVKPKADNFASKEERPVFGPCSIKQKYILQDDTTDILLCGGGAGGGKSHTCLTKALKFIKDPAARVIILRRSYPNLKIPGGLVDESRGIYKWVKGSEFNKQNLEWSFPNGASIKFMAIPDDLAEWQGLQASHMLIDEAAEFKEDEILFLLSRLRSARYNGHLSVTMTCNPSRDSFLYEWVLYSLDETTGVPREGTEDTIRYLANLAGKIRWASTVDDLWKICEPLGAVRYAAKEDDITFLPMSFRFIPLTIHDNPILKKRNPAYYARLLGMKRVDRARFLDGSWTARATGEGYFRRDWVEIVDSPPVNPIARVRSWDLAASIPSETNRNPDWTVGLKMSRDKFGIYYIEDMHRFQKLADGVLKEIILTAKNCDDRDTRVTIPRDPGAGGKTANQFHLRTLAENGVAASSVTISGHNGKLSRFLPFCTLAESNSVRLVKGDWNEAFLAELEFFDGSRNKKDDIVDATSDAFNSLSSQIALPSFILPAMTQANPVPRL